MSGTVERCKITIDPVTFDLGCLAPAMAIILVLGFLGRRKHKWLQFLGGRPGLVIPANLLGGTHNRYAIAVAFGTIATQIFKILLGYKTLVAHWPSWTKVFQYVIFVMVYGIIYYPLLACLTTDRKLVGSLMGLLYSVIRFSVGIAHNFQCNEISGVGGISKIFDYQDLLLNIPVHLCMLFLVLKFAYLFYKEARSKCSRQAADVDQRRPAIFVDHEPLAKFAEIIHVKNLLNLKDRPPQLVGWYIKLRDKIYKPRPDFMFSTQVLSTLFVGVLVLYQFVVAVNFSVARHAIDLERRKYPQLLIDILQGSVYAAVNTAWIPVVVMLFFFMKNHRNNITRLWQSSEDVFTGVQLSPVKFVGTSLRYSGYQVAYIFWGCFLFFLYLLIFFLILSCVIKSEALLGIEPKGLVINWLKTFGSIVFTAGSIWMIQFLLAHVAFNDLEYPNNTITINNREAYNVMSFFLFFLHMVVGALSGLKLLARVLIYGSLFLPRLDRSSLMQGYQKQDKGYMSYVGLVHVLVAHRHPVLLVFCHLLDINKKHQINQSALPYITTRNQNARFSQKALNRWFLTLTLMRNPSLLTFRKRHLNAQKLEMPVSVKSKEQAVA